MAIICREHKLLYILVPGTGSSSLGNILLKEFGGEWLPKQDILNRNSKKVLDRKHNTIQQLISFNLVTEEELQSYWKFANIRNPFDRYATQYERLVGNWIQQRIHSDNSDSWFNRSGESYREQLLKETNQKIEEAKNIGFDKWLCKKLNQTKAFKEHKINNSNNLNLSELYPFTVGIDRVVRSEYLEQDFNFLLKEANIIKEQDKIVIPHTNKTEGKKSYQQYYARRTRNMLENLFGQELAIFNYNFVNSKTNNNLSQDNAMALVRSKWQEINQNYLELATCSNK